MQIFFNHKLVLGLMHNSKTALKSMIIVTIVVCVLITLKITFGLISNARVLISDAVESSTDLVVALASIVGLFLASRPPDSKFGYGYYKVENLVSFFISILIMGSSWKLIYDAIIDFSKEPAISVPYFALGTALFSSCVSLTIGLYLRQVAKETSSPTIEANGKDKILDSIRSIIIFATILASYFKVKYVETTITILISLLAIKVGLEIGKDAVYALLDITEPGMASKVREILETSTDILDFADIRIRKSGAYFFGDCEIKIPDSIGFKDAHKISEKIKEAIHSEFPNIISFVIHIEPEERPDRIMIFPVDDEKGLDSKISEHFGRASSLLLIETDLDTREIQRIEHLHNPFSSQDSFAGLALSRMMSEHNVNTLVTRNLGEIVFYKLKGKSIDLLKAQGNTVKECLDLLYQKKFEHIEQPTKEKEI